MTAGPAVIPQLVLTLAAPYGSFAVTFNAANAAVKATRLDPPKSAIVGLLGAALGRGRLELNALSDGLFVAVRTGVPPRPDPKPDYHTITPPIPPRERGPWTRFEELRPALSGLADAGAILSTRHHWETGLWLVALARRGEEGPGLEELRDALEAPRWPLYAGRKACALGLPPDPAIIPAAGPIAALDAYGWPWTRHAALETLLKPLVDRTRGGAPGRDDAARAAEPSRSFALSFDLDYPGAPGRTERFEREEADEPFHGGSEGRLIRGFRARRVGFVSAQASPGASPGAATDARTG